MELPEIQRRRSRAVRVGGLTIGGDAPVSVQSMTTTVTADAAATIAQVRRLAEAGADLVRVAAPSAADTAALQQIVAESPVPIVADVHFHFRRALEAVAAGVAKIRLNPGNIADRGHVREVIAACKAAGVAIRIGVNEGSVVDRGAGEKRARQLARPLVEVMLDSAEQYIDIFRQEGFDDLVLSAKSHDAVTCIAVNRALAERYDYPLHLGLTHAGTAETGVIRSVAAIGALLADGLGETVRISLAGDPGAEVVAAVELLCSLRLRERRAVEVIACPTCGRTTADVAGLAGQVRRRLADVTRHVTVAVMGCVVNGPGEAEGTDVAACCGQGRAAIYRQGRHVRTVADGEIVAALEAEVRRLVDPGAVSRSART